MAQDHIVRSLRTTDRAEAIKRLPVVVGSIKAEIEAARRDAEGRLRAAPANRRVEPEGVAAWWRERIVVAGREPAQGIPPELEPEWDAYLTERLGEPVGVAVDDDGEAREAFAPEREAEVHALIAAVTGTSVAAEAERYIRERGWSARQAEKLNRALALLSPWLAKRPGGDRRDALTRREAGLFVDHLIEGGRTTATANALVSALSAYWTWMEQRGVGRGNPWRDQSRRTTAVDASADKRSFTDAEVVALLSGSTYSTLHDLMRLAALSGMRLGEIGGLTVAESRGGLFRIREAKTKAGVREVPVHPDLAALVARRSAGKAASAFLIEELRGSPSGRRGRTAKASERFTAYRRSVGVDSRKPGQRQADIDFHSFRRWFTTQAERAGQPPHTISTVVGHAEGRKGMTLGRYSDGASEAQARRVVHSVRLPEGAPVDTPGGPVMGAGRRS
jgi:integrase